MNARIVLVGSALAMVALGGCAEGTKSGRGFHMPTADAQKGKAAFVALGCNDCHTVEGVTLPETGSTPLMAVRLGGEVTRPRTYGELVTAIIYPEHRLTLTIPREVAIPPGKSPMRDVTGEMTVAQLMDIVTFLEPQYKRSEPQYVAGLP